MTTQKLEQLRQKHGSNDNPFAAMGFFSFWLVSMVFYLTFRFSLGLCLLVMGRHRTKQLIRALVQNGDRICLDAAARRLELLVSDDELARRRAALQLPVTSPNRGYGKLFHDHVVQAPGGVDFDFLQGVDPADADAGA
jgi:hypothetical protein